MAANPDGSSYLNDGVIAPQVSSNCHGDQGVIAVAPLRIDLTGGFTDIPPFSSSVDSLHINAAFDLKVTVSCCRRRDRQVRVSFLRDSSHATNKASEGRQRFLEAARIAVAEFSGDEGLELVISSQAPPGSGLGSSGAILVAAIKGCATLAGVSLSESMVARKAILAAAAAGIVGGQQDEFAAAHGSLRAYRFDHGGEPQIFDFTSNDIQRSLEESLLVVQMSTGGRRTDVVGDVVRAVRGADRETVDALMHLQGLAQELFEALNRGRPEKLPRCFARIRETQCALHPRMCCPVTANVIETVRMQIPELEYKVLGGGGPGSCVLVHVPACDRNTAKLLLRRYARRALEVRIQTHGVLAEFAEIAADLKS